MGEIVMSIGNNHKTLKDGRYDSFNPKLEEKIYRQEELENQVKYIMDSWDNPADKFIKLNKIFPNAKLRYVEDFKPFEREYNAVLSSPQRMVELVTAFVSKLITKALSVPLISAGIVTYVVGSAIQAVGKATISPIKGLGTAISEVGIVAVKTGITTGLAGVGDISSPTKRLVQTRKHGAKKEQPFQEHIRRTRQSGAKKSY